MRRQKLLIETQWVLKSHPAKVDLQPEASLA